LERGLDGGGGRGLRHLLLVISVVIILPEKSLMTLISLTY
jgi:hypothetical protein